MAAALVFATQVLPVVHGLHTFLDAAFYAVILSMQL